MHHCSYGILQLIIRSFLIDSSHLIPIGRFAKLFICLEIKNQSTPVYVYLVIPQYHFSGTHFINVGLSDPCTRKCFVPADDKRFFETLLQCNVVETDFMLKVIRLSIPRLIPPL
jgi:hypothetical protein